jgi:hypothetical protein
MAWPDPNPVPFAGWDVTSRTEKQVLDQTLWEMMMSKSALLEVISDGGSIPSTRYEWEYRQPNTYTVTASGTTDTNIDGSGTNQTLVVTDASLIEQGAILRNRTVATPIGTPAVNELLFVTDVTSTTLTVKRDYANRNSGTGSTAHTDTSVFDILYTPKQEGSSVGPNLWKAYGIAENYTATIDMYLTITGSQEKRAMNLGNDQIAIQWEDRMLEKKNDIVNALLYGALGSYGNGADGGSTGYIRNMKGLFHWITASGGNVDYTNTTLTPALLNTAFKNIMDDGGDPSENYVILCNPLAQQEISTWGAELVRTTLDERRYGRMITSFMSDLGYTARIISDPLVFSTDLMIVNTRKFKRLTYRPWFKKEAPTLDDARYMRAITEFTCQVVDPLTAHAAFTKLAW